jgi:hypothetical protein
MSFRHRSSLTTLALSSFIGAALLLVNAHTTANPRVLYGADVWDAAPHQYGYYAAKLFLAFEWMYLYPIAITLALSCMYVAWSIVARVTKGEGSAQLPPFAPDGCGGFRSLGELMLAVVYLDIPFIIVLLALAYTVAFFYWTLGVGVVLLILGVAVQMFLPFVQLHRFLKKAKYARLVELQKVIEKLWGQWSTSGRDNELALLATNVLYERTSRLSTWPYVAGDSIRVALSFLPVVTAIARLMS